MKKLLLVILFLALTILGFMDCHKNPMNSPGPVNTGKGCRVMDYSDSASSVVAGIVRHFHFQYNDLDKLVFFGEENVFHYEVSYDALGRISKINHFQGNLPAPPSFTVLYTGDFVTQLNFLDGSGNATSSETLSWNSGGFGELDRVDIPKTQFSSPGYLAFFYSQNQGFAEYHAGSTDPLDPYDRIMVQSIPVNIRPAVANPFFSNTTKDERFLYWLFLSGFGPIGNLSALNGGGWNDDILSFYTYDANGQKSTFSHEKFEFVLDSNNNVIKRIAYVAKDSPGFSNFVKFDENIISYQCK